MVCSSLANINFLRQQPDFHEPVTKDSFLDNSTSVMNMYGNVFQPSSVLNPKIIVLIIGGTWLLQKSAPCGVGSILTGTPSRNCIHNFVDKTTSVVFQTFIVVFVMISFEYSRSLVRQGIKSHEQEIIFRNIFLRLVQC